MHNSFELSIEFRSKIKLILSSMVLALDFFSIPFSSCTLRKEKMNAKQDGSLLIDDHKWNQVKFIRYLYTFAQLWEPLMSRISSYICLKQSNSEYFCIHINYTMHYILLAKCITLNEAGFRRCHDRCRCCCCNYCCSWMQRYVCKLLTYL